LGAFDEFSVVAVWFTEPDVVLSVDSEVTRVDVVALHHHLEDLWLVDSALLHEIDDLILHHDGMVNIVVQLHLNFIL